MADRLRRESRYRSEDDDDDELEDLIIQPLRRAHPLQSFDSLPSGSSLRYSSRAHDPIRATRLRTPSRIGPKSTHGDSESLVMPNARFFIARHKNKITIKFHPAM